MNNAFFHDLVPKVIISESIKNPKFKFKLPNIKSFKPLISVIVLILIILAVPAGFMLKKYAENFLAPKPQGQFTYKLDMEQTMKQTFTDPKDQDILKYIQFALIDRTLETKYIDYSKAYQLIYQKYSGSATIPIQQAAIKLRVYLRAYPQYNEADFKILK